MTNYYFLSFLFTLLTPLTTLSNPTIPPYVPHQIKNYEYCYNSSLYYEIQEIYVMNTMTSFEGILIGIPSNEIICGKISMMKECNNITYPMESPLDLCDYTNCPIESSSSSLIAFHSMEPLPYNQICNIHLEILQGEWSFPSSAEPMCQNLTMLSCVNFKVE